MNNAMKLLEENSVFWSKLGYCYDPPRFDANGKEILFASDFDYFTRIQDDFAKAGIKIFSSILFSGWVGVDTYDYELTDKVLASVFEKTPDVLYIPRIKLNVPIDWCQTNPKEVFVYCDGPRDVEQIRDLVGSPKHDILGYDAPNGYQNTFGYKDDRPNIDGVIALQSFSSKKWLSDAGEALRRVIGHIENGPYSKQILGYHIAYGVCGETCLWGRFGKKLPGDWGIANRRAFFDWGMTRYGSSKKLKAAWSRPELARNNAEPPEPAQRQGASSSLKELMRGNATDKICIDYDLFTSDVNVDAMEHFGRIVKECADDKPVGYFYGYILECENAAYSGWLGYERVLNSPYIDFLAGPKSYLRNEPGEPGGLLAPIQSINRKKLWMDEIDSRTHLVPDSSCKSFNDSRSVLWREFSKNLSLDSNYWWMDLGGGWYDSPELMREIATIEKLAEELRAVPHQSIAQTLLLIDETSIAHLKCGSPLHFMLIKNWLREFTLSGAPVDIYRLSDLEDMELSQYRLIVPLNAFALNPARWKRMKNRISDDATILWNYAPGVIDDLFSLDNINRLTGFSVRERPAAKSIKLVFDEMPACEWNSEKYGLNELPHLEILPDDQQKILGCYSDGGIALAAKGNSTYCTAPLLKAEHLRYIMAKAGCDLYAPDGIVVYGDNRFIAVFNNEATDFELRLPSLCNAVDAVTGAPCRNVDSLHLSMPKHSMHFLILTAAGKDTEESEKN